MKNAPINLPPLPDWPIAKQFKSPQEVVNRLEFAKREESTLVAACWIAAHWLKSADAAVLADRAAASAEPTKRLTAEAIIQAVARGWCHPKNSHKTMDADLAEAIAAEIFNLNAAAPSPSVKEQGNEP